MPLGEVGPHEREGKTLFYRHWPV